MHLGKDGWGVGLLWEASRAVSLSLSLGLHSPLQAFLEICQQGRFFTWQLRAPQVTKSKSPHPLRLRS